MSRKNIVICGYPKSGTTWLSRLVAQLVACPFMGSLGYSDGVALEGGERVSEYDCYKSHHTLDALLSLHPGEWFATIYVVRDPRDVAISAAHYFQIDALPAWMGPNRVIRALNARTSRFLPYAFKLRKSIHAVLNGDRAMNLWLAMSWRDHCLPFLDSDVLIVRYEDLLKEPTTQCARILAHMGIQRPDEHIRAAVAAQSFQTKRNFFKSRGLSVEQALLRRGSCGYWRDEMGRKEKNLFVAELNDLLERLSYSIE